MKSLGFLSGRYNGAGNMRHAERVIELAAIAVAVLLLLQLLFAFVRLINLSSPDAIHPNIDGISDVMPSSLEKVDAAQSSQIRERPLFWTSRRPSQSSGGTGEAAGESAKSGSINKVKVVGLFGGGDSSGIIALVRAKKRRILLNEQVEGWTLESVERNEVVFARDGRRKKVVLMPQKYVVTPGTANSGSAESATQHSGPSGNPSIPVQKEGQQAGGLGFGPPG